MSDDGLALAGVLRKCSGYGFAAFRHGPGATWDLEGAPSPGAGVGDGRGREWIGRIRGSMYAMTCTMATLRPGCRPPSAVESRPRHDFAVIFGKSDFPPYGSSVRDAPLAISDRIHPPCPHADLRSPPHFSFLHQYGAGPSPDGIITLKWSSVSWHHSRRQDRMLASRGAKRELAARFTISPGSALKSNSCSRYRPQS